MRAKVSIVAVFVVVATAATAAATESYPWRDHAEPFAYEFGNHIDSHQQSLVKGSMLQGFFYITLSDQIDQVSGLPEATHGNCEDNPDGCTVGWVWHGKPVEATLIAHGGGQHPTWCIDPADMPRQPGYTHFHWTGEPASAMDLATRVPMDGWLLRLTAVDAFFFTHHGGLAITPGIDYESHANVTTECDALG